MEDKPSKDTKVSKLKSIKLVDIEGYDNYALSSTGVVYNRKTKRTLKNAKITYKLKKGGLSTTNIITLSKDGIKTNYCISTLLKKYFPT